VCARRWRKLEDLKEIRPDESDYDAILDSRISDFRTWCKDDRMLMEAEQLVEKLKIEVRFLFQASSFVNSMILSNS
jgi:hypothetical protein